MIEIGRVCVKLAGRDAGKKCVVVDFIDDNTVLIDGFTRRRKCNLRHLEPLEETLSIEKGASSDEVCSAFNITKKAKKESQKFQKPATRKKRAKAQSKEATPGKPEKGKSKAAKPAK